MKEETKDPLLERFQTSVNLYEDAVKSWEREGDEIMKIYRNEASDKTRDFYSSKTTYNILWSNIQALLPAHYSKLARPVVVRRWKDKNSISRIAAELSERAIAFTVSDQEDEINQAMHKTVLDKLLPGRGTICVNYHAKTKKYRKKSTNEEFKKKEDEKICYRYVHWKDFGHTLTSDWYDLDEVWKKEYLTPEELKRRFPHISPSKIKPTQDDKDLDRDKDLSSATKDYFKRRCVIEYWDKNTQKVYWFSPGYKNEFLDSSEDLYKLRCFFPFPRPLYATTDGDSLIPTADFTIYKELALDLDTLCKRLANLTRAVKAVGVHNGAINETLNLIEDPSLRDGTTKPIKGWTAYAESGGMSRNMEWLPVEIFVGAIRELQARKSQVIQEIYEISGVSDLLRGATNPYETAHAQERKFQTLTQRLSLRQADIQRFVRDLYRITAELIFEFYSVEKIKQIVGYDSWEESHQYFDDALALLKDDKLRTFTVEIETDSTIQANEGDDQERAINFLNAIATIFNQSTTMLEYMPETKTLILDALLFATRRFRAGRPLEASIERTIEDIHAADEAAAQQPPEPDPEQMKLQAEMQKHQDTMNLKMQELQRKAAEDQVQAQTSFEKLKIESEKMINDVRSKLEKIHSERELRDREITLQVKQIAIEEGKLTLAKRVADDDKEIKEKKLEIEAAKVASESESRAQQQEQPKEQRPIAITLNSGKKRAVIETDPKTGNKVATIEEVADGV